jgi:hypothetical protein
MRNLSFAFALVSFAACTSSHTNTMPGNDELAGENGDDGSKADFAGAHDTMGYLAVTKTGACENPITCTPYQLTRPNRSQVTCNDNQLHDSCGVRGMSYAVLGLSQDQQNAIEAALDAQTADPTIGTQILVKGSYKIFVDFLAFQVTEVWMAQMPNGSTDGTWVLLSDSGIRCFGQCKSTREEKLNSTRSMLINGIDFSSDSDSSFVSAVDAQKLTPAGVIVVGDRTEGQGVTGGVTELRSVNQAFFPVVAAGGHPQGSFCTDFTRCDDGLVCTGSNGGPGTCQPQ